MSVAARPWRTELGSLARADRGRLAVGILAVIVSGLLVAAAPIVIRNGFDHGIASGDRGALRVAAAVLVGLLVLGGVTSGIRTLCMAQVAQRILHDLRGRGARGLLRMDLANFEARSRGDVQARLTSDVERLSSAAETLLPDITRDVIFVAGGLAAVGVLSPPLLVVLALTLPPAALAGRWLVRRAGVVYPALLTRNGAALGVLTETIEGAPTIAALGAERRQLGHLDTAGQTLITADVAAATMRNWFYSTLLLIQAVGSAALVVGAGLLTLDGRISTGTAAAAILALSGVFGPMSLLIGRFDDVLAARSALERVLELDAIAQPRHGTATLSSRGTLRLDGVTYAYPSNGDGSPAPAVDGIDLTVAPGEHVALVGPTGAGKSTIARLAAGLATPSAGRVTLDDVDIATAAGHDRRERLLFVPQETYLVDGTIADNVRLAHPALPDSAVERAVDTLGVRAWIDRLPAGIATPTGANGDRLSAGERQLVTLLRVAVADPAVLVLDEATSVLDHDSEDAVAAALARIGADRAVLIVAHRALTAQRCNRVVVVRGGRVVAVGTPADIDLGAL